jgi:hypothetical protein
MNVGLSEGCKTTRKDATTKSWSSMRGYEK